MISLQYYCNYQICLYLTLFSHWYKFMTNDNVLCFVFQHQKGRGTALTHFLNFMKRSIFQYLLKMIKQNKYSTATLLYGPYSTTIYLMLQRIKKYNIINATSIKGLALLERKHISCRLSSQSLKQMLILWDRMEL